MPRRAVDGVEAFAATHGWPVVLKAARGGYDGKGVWPVDDRAAAEAVLAGIAGAGRWSRSSSRCDAELAVMVARRPSGEAVAWPAVETAQVGGVCREVLVPGRLAAEVLGGRVALGQKVAEIVEAVGVMAVELFWSRGPPPGQRSRDRGRTTRATGRWRAP